MKNYLFSAIALAFASVTVNAQTTTCADPTGIQVQRLSDSDAWISSADNTANYDIYIKPTGQAAPTATTAPRTGYANLTFPLFSSELVPQYGYDLYVRTNCGNGDTSDWTGPIFIDTYQACNTPVISIDRTSATEASFTASDTSAVFDYYVVLDGIAGPAAQDWFTGPNYAGANDVMSGHSRNDLAPQFGYDVYFRKQCSDTQVSEWVGPIDLDPYVEPCVPPTASEVVITRDSHTTATFDGANPAFNYQGSANLPGRPLRPRPMYGMDNMSLPHTQSGLIQQFEYHVWFRAICDDGSFSDWSQPFLVPLYQEPCEDAMDVEIVRESDLIATITSSNTDQVYDIYVSLSGQAGPAVGAEPNAWGNNDVTFPFTRYNLDPGRAYDIYVRTQCDNSNATEWIGPFNIPATPTGSYALKASLSPNPVKDIVTIEGVNAVSAQVINITGKAELNTKVSNNTLNVANLAPGQYILNVTDSEGKTQAVQFIKK